MKKLILAACLAACAGCANLVIRPQCDYNQGPYYCTRTVNTCISRGFDGKPIERMFLPVLFIDWPFDALTDTLFWPWDALRYNSRFSVENPYAVEGDNK